MIILVASNGIGIGHLTRQLAVGLSLPESDRAILSLAVGAALVEPMGVPIEYCPSYDRGWMDTPTWHRYFEDRLVALAEEVNADVISFDGVAPYRGLIRARKRLPGVAFVWQRRGMWRQKARTTRRKVDGFFHTVLEPGDIAAPQRDDGGQAIDRVVHVPPISLGHAMERLGRAEAAAELGVDPGRPTAVVTMGSAMPGAAPDLGGLAAEELARNDGWQVCVANPSLALRRIPASGDIVVLEDVYPLARYLNIFDAAVSAAGYNTVHELVPGRVPTLLIPNSSATTDDQVGRASRLADQGLALAVTDGDPTGIREAVRRLVDEGTRSSLADALAEADLDVDGGGVVARHLTDLAGRTPVERPTPFALRYRSEELVLSTLGRVRRSPGPSPNGPDSRPEDTLSDTLRGFDLRSTPVEHVLAGTSERYRERRLAIAAGYHDGR